VIGLYALKPWYSRRLRSTVDVAVARGVSPDAFSALAKVLHPWLRQFYGRYLATHAHRAELELTSLR
jgi:hypothetical protein